jgi:hypothetical protein
MNSLVACLTNGTDDPLALGFDFGASGNSESTMLGTSPDLAGRQIADIRGTINSVTLSYNAGQTRCVYSGSVTFEIWGKPIGCP